MGLLCSAGSSGKRSLALSLPPALPELAQSIRDALDSQLGKLVHALVLEVQESDIGLADEPLVLLVARLPRVDDQDHAGVEGLLAHGPADEHGGVAVVEEEEGLQEGEGGLDHERAAADGCRVWDVFGDGGCIGGAGCCCGGVRTTR